MACHTLIYFRASRRDVEARYMIINAVKCGSGGLANLFGR
jgi:hypothetical protein